MPSHVWTMGCGGGVIICAIWAGLLQQNKRGSGFQGAHDMLMSNKNHCWCLESNKTCAANPRLFSSTWGTSEQSNLSEEWQIRANMRCGWIFWFVFLKKLSPKLSWCHVISNLERRILFAVRRVLRSSTTLSVTKNRGFISREISILILFIPPFIKQDLVTELWWTNIFSKPIQIPRFIFDIFAGLLPPLMLPRATSLQAVYHQIPLEPKKFTFKIFLLSPFHDFDVRKLLCATQNNRGHRCKVTIEFKV